MFDPPWLRNPWAESTKVQNIEYQWHHKMVLKPTGRVNRSPKQNVAVAPLNGGSVRPDQLKKKTQQDQMNFIQQKELKKDKLTTKFLKITVG